MKQVLVHTLFFAIKNVVSFYKDNDVTTCYLEKYRMFFPSYFAWVPYSEMLIDSLTFLISKFLLVSRKVLNAIFFKILYPGTDFIEFGLRLCFQSFSKFALRTSTKSPLLLLI